MKKYVLFYTIAILGCVWFSIIQQISPTVAVPTVTATNKPKVIVIETNTPRIVNQEFDEHEEKVKAFLKDLFLQSLNIQPVYDAPYVKIEVPYSETDEIKFQDLLYYRDIEKLYTETTGYKCRFISVWWDDIKIYFKKP